MAEKRKNLFEYITPSILSMLAIFLFTIVDGIFVGRGVSTDALGAVNIVFPYIMIFMGIITMCSVGGMTIIAIRMGREEYESANTAFMHGLTLCVIISVVMELIGVLFTRSILQFLGVTNVFAQLSYDYLFWYSVFLFPCGLFIFFCGTVRNDGNPGLVSKAVVLTSVLNIFGDWLLIYPLHMGTKGAALATGVSQCIGLLIILSHFFRKKGILRFHKFKPDISLFKKIIIRGIPECVNQFAAPISVIFMNFALAKYIGSIGVNAFALLCYVVGLATSFASGTAEGLQPLFGRAYGARSREDLRYYLIRGILIGFVGTTIIVILIVCFCPVIYSLFEAEADTLIMAVHATHIFEWGYLPVAVSTVISSYLYSTTRTVSAMIINLLRGFFINISIIVLLPMIFGGEYIWFCMPVFESVVFVIACIIRKHDDKRMVFSEEKD